MYAVNRFEPRRFDIVKIESGSNKALSLVDKDTNSRAIHFLSSLNSKLEGRDEVPAELSERITSSISDVVNACKKRNPTIYKIQAFLNPFSNAYKIESLRDKILSRISPITKVQLSEEKGAVIAVKNDKLKAMLSCALIGKYNSRCTLYYSQEGVISMAKAEDNILVRDSKPFKKDQNLFSFEVEVNQDLSEISIVRPKGDNALLDSHIGKIKEGFEKEVNLVFHKIEDNYLSRMLDRLKIDNPILRFNPEKPGTNLEHNSMVPGGRFMTVEVMVRNAKPYASHSDLEGAYIFKGVQIMYNRSDDSYHINLGDNSDVDYTKMHGAIPGTNVLSGTEYVEKTEAELEETKKVLLNLLSQSGP